MLSHLTSVTKSLVTPGTEIFADLEGHKINGTTVPTDIHPPGGEGSKPDLVILNRQQKQIALMELTCPLQ